MNPIWQLRTGRLLMQPVGFGDLADLVELKGDPRAFAVMLGGVRSAAMVAEELASEMSDWARLGYGVWAVRSAVDRRFVGLVGLQDRPDGRGVGLRFALRPQEQGFGFAAEAAGAALRFGHDWAGLERIVAAAREDNFASRAVLGAIGMVQVDAFVREGLVILVFQSLRQQSHAPR
jgi:RimJ/RimL family protein N-acetyltransferase